MRVRKTCCATSVESTARDAHDRDYQVIVIQDACAARSDEDHGHGLKMGCATGRPWRREIERQGDRRCVSWCW
ncbi:MULTISPECIES: isochorismatase family protein [Cupriavidus]|uniref:isochorismatase family protein n=1 Tax=unclassified Cupriavidus TaxID=2640874 RepID=UPI0021018AD0|nr:MULTISPECIES: isochorismatase family protein [unclassified Cupriavidus]